MHNKIIKQFNKKSKTAANTGYMRKWLFRSQVSTLYFIPGYLPVDNFDFY